MSRGSVSEAVTEVSVNPELELVSDDPASGAQGQALISDLKVVVDFVDFAVNKFDVYRQPGDGKWIERRDLGRYMFEKKGITEAFFIVIDGLKLAGCLNDKDPSEKGDSPLPGFLGPGHSRGSDVERPGPVEESGAPEPKAETPTQDRVPVTNSFLQKVAKSARNDHVFWQVYYDSHTGAYLTGNKYLTPKRASAEKTAKCASHQEHYTKQLDTLLAKLASMSIDQDGAQYSSDLAGDLSTIAEADESKDPANSPARALDALQQRIKAANSRCESHRQPHYMCVPTWLMQSTANLRRERAELASIEQIMVHGTSAMVCRLLSQHNMSLDSRTARLLLDENSSPVADRLLSLKLQSVTRRAPQILDDKTSDLTPFSPSKPLNHEDVHYLAETYGRFGATSIVEIHREMAEIDDLLAKKQAFETKVVAGVCSLAILVGQWAIASFVRDEVSISAS